MMYRVTGRVAIVLYPGLVSGIDAISVLIDCGGSHVLVDSGSGLPASINALARNLVEAGASPRTLRYLVNTHSHVNNAGGDYWVRLLMGPIIVAHSPDSRAIETGDPVSTGAGDLGLAFKPVPVGLELRGEYWKVPECGDVGVTAIHTPGHTPGSMSVYVEDNAHRVLIVGDALGSLSRRWGSSEEEWYKSLGKIASLEPDILCTSVACLRGQEAVDFIRDSESKGPVWVD